MAERGFLRPEVRFHAVLETGEPVLFAGAGAGGRVAPKGSGPRLLRTLRRTWV